MRSLRHGNIQRYSLSVVIIFFIMLLAMPESKAQSLAETNLSSVKVDDLSDEQLLQYYQQAQQSGYTQAQLEAFAKQRGMPQSEIIKLRRRINQLRLSVGGSDADNFEVGSRSSKQQSEDDLLGRLTEGNLKDELTEEQRKIFGFGLFRSQDLTFAPNLNIPTPKDYVLGPGDEISVDLWGSTQQYWTFEVSPEGTVRPQDLSPVYVNGLTVEEAEQKIINRLSQVYGGLKGAGTEDPSIFYQVSLSTVRTINITVVGEVARPGNYSLNSLSTVFTALYAAGGPTEVGTFRSITLIRNNKRKASIDLYDFLVEGMKPNDEVLRDGDVVVVKMFDGKVELEGEIKRSGLYEITSGQTLEELLYHAGGFTSNAFKSFVTIRRNSLSGKEILNILPEDFAKFELQDGDFVTVRRVQEIYSNRVQIEGAVQLEGQYQLTEGLTVKGLIDRANGIKGDAYLSRATIYRMRQDFSQETIPFDLQKLLSGEIEDIQLQNEDIIKVNSIYDLSEEFYVEINGEVSGAGVFPYFRNMTVEDLILLAGGLNRGASAVKVEVSRRNVNSSSSVLSEILTFSIDPEYKVGDNSSDIFLQPFDQVFIRKKPNYQLQQLVTIEGEVSSPGVYSIGRKDERISDILERAGGLTPYAYAEGALLVRRAEFVEEKTDSEINLTKLDELKTKILNDTSQSMNQARTLLIERLEKLMVETESDEQAEEDAIGNRIKKELTEGLVNSDSLSTVAEINEEEPTVLELNEILKNPGSKYDYILREGDVISIPPKLETVRVAGEVISPLNLRYDKAFSFKDYINDAGGFTSRAKKGRSYVQYPNGRRKQARRFLFFKFYPKVEPGSTVYVSTKPDRPPVNLQTIIALSGSLATMILVIDRLGN